MNGGGGNRRMFSHQDSSCFTSGCVPFAVSFALPMEGLTGKLAPVTSVASPASSDGKTSAANSSVPLDGLLFTVCRRFRFRADTLRVFASGPGGASNVDFAFSGHSTLKCPGFRQEWHITFDLSKNVQTDVLGFDAID